MKLLSALRDLVPESARSLLLKGASVAFRASLPSYQGITTVDGLYSSVSIRRDQWGIPVIEAQNSEDAWFGLGFCHGQDRAGQLELMHRVVNGRVSEVAGKDGINIDRLSRRVGLKKAALAQFAVADDAVKKQLEAYARGINAGATQGGGGKAPDFLLLWTRPSVWTGADVQGMSALLCFTLASNWDVELVRLKVLTSDGPEALAKLDATYPEHLPISARPGVEAGKAADRLAEDLAAFGDLVGHGGGSNAWVIGADKTATGRPIVANDPHLVPSQPAFWYLAHVRTPEWAVAGASFVGTAAIGAGHNGRGAWGVTAAHADNTDLFVEEVGPDGRSVREGDEFVPCEVRTELIRVRGGDDIVERVIETPRGPIVSPAFDGESGAIAMAATWLAARPYNGFYGVHDTDNFTEFRESFRQSSTATGSLVYAHEDGEIGWFLCVELPQRQNGSGTIPLPGWEENTGWAEEPVSFDELPHATNGEAGFYATANNQPESDGHGPFLGVDFLDGYRQAAITEKLAARDDWTLDDTLAMQLDTESLPWREMKDSILAHEGGSPEAKQALDLLRNWDGHVRADSSAASVYELFVTSVAQQVIESIAPRSAHWLLGRGATELLPYNLLVTRRLAEVVRWLVEQPADLLDKPWSAVIEEALRSSVKRLSSARGSDSRRWGWAAFRPLWLEHLFSQTPPLGTIYNVGPITTGGDASTISAASVDFEDPAANAVGVPTLRFAIDVGNWSESRFILIGGQSGHPFSPHYRDMVERWERNDGVAIPWTEEEIQEATIHTLTLNPR